MEQDQSILEVRNIVKKFPIRAGVFSQIKAYVTAVDDVSFEVKNGETLGLVGESGCGKSTLARTLMRLYEPSSGEIFFNGKDLISLSKSEMRTMRREIQMIFQDPFESLNSRHSIGKIISEPLLVHKIGTRKERQERVSELLQKVGLQPDAKHRFPHEFSGGQRQRIGIARAIAMRPKLIVCDEPVSALDVSIQSQVLNLLLDLQKEMKLTLLFIAHDLSVVRHISDRVAVMYLGSIVEITDSESIYKNAMHPYTKALLASIPIADPKYKMDLNPIEGEVPSPINMPKGCKFAGRCPHKKEICEEQRPKLQEQAPGHLVACHFAKDLS